jgi:hypothetical protein
VESVGSVDRRVEISGRVLAIWPVYMRRGLPVHPLEVMAVAPGTRRIFEAAAACNDTTLAQLGIDPDVVDSTASDLPDVKLLGP